MLLVVGGLDAAAPVGLVDRALHRTGDAIGVQDHMPVDVAGGPADRLDQRARVTQVALLVGVQDRDERDFRQVQPLPKQVDPDEHVEDPQPQVAQDLDSLQGVDVGVQIVHLDARLAQVVRQVLRHFLRQHGDQGALLPVDAFFDFTQQVIDLALRRPDLDRWIDQPRRPDENLDRLLRALLFVGARRGRHVDHLLDLALPLGKRQRSVVERRRQTEAVIDERDLPRPVAAVHAADLGHADVRLVDHDQGVLRQEIHQGVGLLAGPPAGEMAGIVLDAGTTPGLAHHLHVEHGSLAQPLRLQ